MIAVPQYFANNSTILDYSPNPHFRLLYVCAFALMVTGCTIWKNCNSPCVCLLFALVQKVLYWHTYLKNRAYIFPLYKFSYLSCPIHVGFCLLSNTVCFGSLEEMVGLTACHYLQRANTKQKRYKATINVWQKYCDI